jgi:hypothetical protein
MVSVESIRLEPPKPGPETLCQLYVTLENRGEHPASLFAFAVEVGGESLDVYEKDLYVVSLAAGAREELRLFNFWTTESGRPMPEDGQLKVEVRLEEASWMQVERHGESEETWTPTGAVEALPSAAGLVVRLLAKPGTDG